MSVPAAAVGVALARGLGLAAAFGFTIFVAHRFGSNRSTDVVFAALVIPQTLSAVLVTLLPSVFTAVFKSIEVSRGRAEAWAFGRSAVRTMVVAGALVTAAGVVASPLLAGAVGAGFTTDQVGQVGRYLQASFLMLFFTIWATTIKGLLNAEGHFFAPSLDTLVLNVAGIVLVATLEGRWGPFAIVAGTAGGTLAKVLLMAPGYLRLRTRGAAPLFHPALSDAWRLLLPVLANSVMVTVSLGLVRGLAAPFVGGISHLQYAERICGAPRDFLMASLGVALLPTLVGHAAGGNLAEVRRLVGLGLRMSFFLGIPAAAGLALLSEPVVALLYQHGQFSAAETAETARSVVGYSGVLAFGGFLILYQAFYALRNTWIILATGSVMIAGNVILGRALLGPFREAGLAAGFSISTVAVFLLSLALFAQKAGWPDVGGVVSGALRATVCTAVMGGVVLAIPDLHVLLRAAAGAIVFAGLSRFLCPVEWGQMRKLWSRPGGLKSDRRLPTVAGG